MQVFEACFEFLVLVTGPMKSLSCTDKLLPVLFLGIICLVSFVLGITTVLSSGEYWLQFIDSHCSGIPLLVIGLVEVLAISYLYGIER